MLLKQSSPKMPNFVWWVLSLFICVELISQIDAKTYYFNKVKSINQYRVYNRVNNTVGSDEYDGQQRSPIGELRHHPSQTYHYNTTTKTKIHSNTYPAIDINQPLLDDEWNYDWKTINRTELPVFLDKFYNSLEDNAIKEIRVLFNTKPKNSWILKYDVNSISENITEANLYFYLKVKDDEEFYKRSIVLRLYQIENELTESKLINPDNHKLLNVIYILKAEDGWQIFKIKNTVLEWLNGENNNGLVITISKPNEDKFIIFRDTNSGKLRSFLEVKLEDDLISYIDSDTPTIDEFNSNSHCKKQHFYIDFRQLNWNRFIIKPYGFEASNCVGRCYKNDPTTSNHAKFMDSVAGYTQKRICCSPTKYAPLPIMFYDANGNVVIKYYKDMIVTQCGCR